MRHGGALSPRDQAPGGKLGGECFDVMVNAFGAVIEHLPKEKKKTGNVRFLYNLGKLKNKFESLSVLYSGRLF